MIQKIKKMIKIS